MAFVSKKVFQCKLHLTSIISECDCWSTRLPIQIWKLGVWDNEFHSRSSLPNQSLVVQRIYSAIHRINHYSPVDLTNRMWHSVVCTLFYNGMSNHSGQNVASGVHNINVKELFFWELKKAFRDALTRAALCGLLSSSPNQPVRSRD